MSPLCAFLFFLLLLVGFLQATACWPGWGEASNVEAPFLALPHAKEVGTAFLNNTVQSLWWLPKSDTTLINEKKCYDLIPLHIGLWLQLPVCPHLLLCHCPLPQDLKLGDNWGHDLSMSVTCIKVREDCTSTSLSCPGPYGCSNKMRSRWLETDLGAVDDIGIFGAWPSSGCSTALCFSHFCGHWIQVISSTEFDQESLHMLR